MTNEQIKEFALAHHAEMVEKGFWSGRSMVKKTLLILGELGEALEAHRKNKRCSIAISIFENKNFENELIRTKFEKEVKDTFEDEIADTMLRLLDFCVYFDKMKYLQDTPEMSLYKLTFDAIQANVADFVKNGASTLDALLFEANDNCLRFKTLSVYICLLEIAKLMNFDLWAHVQAKRKYNKTRPFMFGKKY